MNRLRRAAGQRRGAAYPLVEIETIYLDANAGSHANRLAGGRAPAPA